MKLKKEGGVGIEQFDMVRRFRLDHGRSALLDDGGFRHHPVEAVPDAVTQDAQKTPHPDFGVVGAQERRRHGLGREPRRAPETDKYQRQSCLDPSHFMRLEDTAFLWPLKRYVKNT